ncbi:invasion associated locus B family protein [Mesorhizobium sp. M1409]|uniref:invasion associated locus B family protein n=1 Tax=unclassified Mesorhizobium TaxID=325217 RepID=UPI0033396D3D
MNNEYRSSRLFDVRGKHEGKRRRTFRLPPYSTNDGPPELVVSNIRNALRIDRAIAYTVWFDEARRSMRRRERGVTSKCLATARTFSPFRLMDSAASCNWSGVRKTGQRVLLIVFNRNGKDKPPLSGTIIAPFGLDLQAGLSLLIKEDVYVKTSYKTCLPQGCVAPIAANGEFEEALRANEKLSVAMTASDTGQPVKLDVSLKGFAQGLDRLAALSARDE